MLLTARKVTVVSPGRAARSRKRTIGSGRPPGPTLAGAALAKGRFAQPTRALSGPRLRSRRTTCVRVITLVPPIA